jgi:hypothetical protein
MARLTYQSEGGPVGTPAQPQAQSEDETGGGAGPGDAGARDTGNSDTGDSDTGDSDTGDSDTGDSDTGEGGWVRTRDLPSSGPTQRHPSSQPGAASRRYRLTARERSNTSHRSSSPPRMRARETG